MIATETMTRRRDKHGYDQIKSLRKKVKNLRSELIIHDTANHRRHKRYYETNRMNEQLIYRNKRLELLLVQLMEQRQWMVERIEHCAKLAHSSDWQERAKKNMDSYLSSFARSFTRITTSPLYPDLAKEAESARDNPLDLS